MATEAEALAICTCPKDRPSTSCPLGLHRVRAAVWSARGDLSSGPTEPIIWSEKS